MPALLARPGFQMSQLPRDLSHDLPKAATLKYSGKPREAVMQKWMFFPNKDAGFFTGKKHWGIPKKGTD